MKASAWESSTAAREQSLSDRKAKMVLEARRYVLALDSAGRLLTFFLGCD